MPIDIKQFYQGFFDEVAEHLEHLEALAVAIDVENPEKEHIAALFRIAHSIKGASGTFGFSSMTTLTHAMETLLDRVRQGRLAMSAEMIDVLLSARDVLQLQLEAYRADTEIDPGAAKQMETELLRFAAETMTGAQHTFEVLYSCKQIGADRAAALDALSDAFSSLGVVRLRPQDAEQPIWRFALRTPAAEQEIRDLCAYLGGPRDGVEIVNAGVRDRGEMVARTKPPQENESYGFFEPVRPARTEPATPSIIPAGGDSDASTIRVRLDKVERLINLAGEMIVTTSTLAQSVQDVDSAVHATLMSTVEVLERQTRDLREGVMAVRMMQVGMLFARFTRVVREAAHKLGKDAVLVTSGDDTELDKGLMEQIADPLAHLIRNAIDHGIEPPALRESLGKERRGTIRLRARQESGRVLIEVSDDGRGLNREAILAKARAFGNEVPADAPDAQVWALVFAPGLSTASEVSDISGRGVGMDIVLANVTRLGGRVDIASKEGLGTTVTLSVPLTLAIIDGLAVRADGQTYVIPLETIVESFSLGERSVHTIGSAHRVVEFRGRQVPLVSITGMSEAATAHRPIAVVVESEGAIAALCVDELEGQYQVVVKSLEANFRRVPGLIGATVMGSGEVAFILDVPAVVAS